MQNLPFHREFIRVESKVKTYGRFIEPFIPPVKYIIAAILLYFLQKSYCSIYAKMLEDVAAQEEGKVQMLF